MPESSSQGQMLPPSRRAGSRHSISTATRILASDQAFLRQLNFDYHEKFLAAVRKDVKDKKKTPVESLRNILLRFRADWQTMYHPEPHIFFQNWTVLIGSDIIFEVFWQTLEEVITLIVPSIKQEINRLKDPNLNQREPHFEYSIVTYGTKWYKRIVGSKKDERETVPFLGGGEKRDWSGMYQQGEMQVKKLNYKVLETFWVLLKDERATLLKAAQVFETLVGMKEHEFRERRKLGRKVEPWYVNAGVFEPRPNKKWYQ